MDKMDTTRSNPKVTAETGHTSKRGRRAGGRLLLCGANRSGLPPTRFAPHNNKSQETGGKTEIYWKLDTSPNTRVRTVLRGFCRVQIDKC